ncbi:LacI family DNA-binding transcriptional regulator [Sphingomonas sp. Leaf412]|uniref:LacI family DNA-binding transcriptional regulator n=1 Tax=Sphingomonas sp. Leaf412 TaxID=1736370 RepID=UPI000A4DDF3D|nr:LacI family DNA-binding transcriptional regulator [Sphingomonas sp. Leaf412]
MSYALDQSATVSRAISPEQRLFLGVVANAAIEAAGGRRIGDTHRTIQQSARAWFANGGDDFAMVCTLAGLEPRTTRDCVLAYVDHVQNNPCTVTMADVAKHAGVSGITVARALKGTGRIAPATTARVIQAAQAIGYSMGGTASVH